MVAKALILTSILLLAGGVYMACAAKMSKAGSAPAQPQAPDKIHAIPVQPMAADTHTSPTLAPWRGKVLLIVNVASKCGFTPQYEGLEKIYRRYQDRGLVVLGFPANDFLNQEPGTEAEIVNFCRAKYDVTFPIYGKIHVKGKEKAPLYQYLTGPSSPFPGEVRWNFEKFLIGPDGRVLARFVSKVKPDSKEVVDAIEKALGGRDALIHATYDPSNGTLSQSIIYRYKQ